jgi:two-component system, OmpR family, response regulator
MNKPKILVVDDDAKLSTLTRVILERVGGYNVLEENRSFAAVATAQAFGPDLVILDVDMPGKDGGEVARELRQLPQFATTPLLFVTSLISKAEAGHVKGWQFLAKPVAPTTLLETVRGLVPSLAGA